MAAFEAFWSFEGFQLTQVLDRAAVFNAIGLAGAFLYLMSYAAVQAGRLDGNGILFTWINTVAAGLVLSGLMYSFNMASVVIQVAWLTIGLARILNAVVPAPLHSQTTKTR